jgi:invasion protein IalB
MMPCRELGASMMAFRNAGFGRMAGMAALMALMALLPTGTAQAAAQADAAPPAKHSAAFQDIDGKMFGVVKATNGAWSTVCNRDDKSQCVLLQRVASEERPEIELSVTFFRYVDKTTKKGGVVMRTSLPLDSNVFLPAGIGLFIDGVDLGRSYFVRCSSFGCFSDAVLDASIVDKLKAGKQAVFTIFLSREEDGMGVPVDLAGFGAAFDGLK